MKLLNITVFLCALFLAAGCDDLGHGHGDDHQHGAASHDHHDSIDVGATRSDDHDDHSHGNDHGHGEGETAVVITHYTHATELFVEFPAFVAGQEIPRIIQWRGYNG